MGVTDSTRIQTSAGSLRVVDIVSERLWEVQQVMLTTRFKPVPLRDVLPAGSERVIRVNTDHGHWIETSHHHHFLVMDRRGNLNPRKARNLRPGDWVCRQGAAGCFGDFTSFPKVAVKERTNYRRLPLPTQFDEDWAAFFALYLAEASPTLARNKQDCTGFQFSLAHEADPELPTKAALLLRKLFKSRLSLSTVRYEKHQDQTRFVTSSVDLGAVLARHVPGDSHIKFVPEFVFRWPRHLQSAFLRWLFANDGTVKKSDNGYTIAYSTASAQLARSVAILLTNFGIRTSLRSETRRGYDGTYWSIELFSSAARKRFGEAIGFVTAAAAETASRAASYTQDRRAIPNQSTRLARLMPFVQGNAKEKCRECVRVNSRVHLNPTRLAIIFGNINFSLLPISIAADACYLLSLLQFPISFEMIKSLDHLKRSVVYEVRTIDRADDAIVADGFFCGRSLSQHDLPISFPRILALAGRRNPDDMDWIKRLGA